MKAQSAIVTAAVTLGLAVPVASAAAATNHRVAPPVMPSVLLQTTGAIPGNCTLTLQQGYLSIYVCTGGASGAPTVRVIGKRPVVVKKKVAAPAPRGCALAPSDRQLSGILCIL
ncbi:MAG TPA: hypothetical protein VLK36_00285 [Gaiellaceae bacterium]|nr:hypothetical protein [Gaiellaceae bacterium]